MFALERQKRILELLNQNGAVWVSKLSQELEVTEETIRRDLEKLEKQEQLMRTHGGAVSIDDSTYELSLEKRKRTNVDVKERLAREAVKNIAPGDTVFLDASTTTFYMARELKTMKNITIITNSLRVVNELAGKEEIKVIAIGGTVSQNLSFVGSVAQNNVDTSYFASKMFFSSKGITKDAGVLESNEQECGIKRSMIENSKKRYYLCDSTKIGRVGFVKIASFDEINYFLTEAELDEEWKERFEKSGTEIIQIKNE